MRIFTAFGITKDGTATTVAGPSSDLKGLSQDARDAAGSGKFLRTLVVDLNRGRVRGYPARKPVEAATPDPEKKKRGRPKKAAASED